MTQARDRTDTPRDTGRGALADRCSIAGAVAALGDTWSIMVLRELFFGVHRFNDLQRDLGVSRSVLSDRLARLVDLGVVRGVPYQHPGERSRLEYRLTRKGVDLLPVMLSLMEWGDRHLNAGDGPVKVYDRTTDEPVRVEMRTPSGRLVGPNEMDPRVNDPPPIPDDPMADDQTFHDDIEGYCGALSYPVGAEVGLHVSTRSSTFDVRVERWGADREPVWAATDVAGVFTPPPSDADAAGCRWPATLQIPIDEHWRSGFHLVTLTAHDAPNGRDVAHAGFVVRGRGVKRAIEPRALLVLATNTWNAYNTWGGRSLYTGGKQVSFGRPFGRGMLCRPEVERDDRKARPVRWGEEPDVDGLIFQRYRTEHAYPSAIGSAGWFTHERRFVEWAEGCGLRVRLRRVVRPRRRPRRGPRRARRLRPRAQRRPRRVLVGRPASRGRGPRAARRQLRQLLGQHDVLAGPPRTPPLDRRRGHRHDLPQVHGARDRPGRGARASTRR